MVKRFLIAGPAAAILLALPFVGFERDASARQPGLGDNADPSPPSLGVGNNARTLSTKLGALPTPPSAAGTNGRRPPPSQGFGNSAGNVAKKQGTTAVPNATPGPFLIAPGIALTANYTGEAAANPVGGLRQGASYAGQIFVGLDFDMQQLARIDGGSVHFAMTQRHGRSLSNDYIGNNTSVQEIYGTQNLHLALLTYEQKLADNRLDIEVGRTVANVAFLASPIYCNFQTNSACGNPTFIFKNSNFTYFPASSWGGHARYAITDKYFIHAGAYEVNPQDKLPTDNGFNFSTEKATGAIVPVEIGYATDFTNDSMPRHYILGGYYDASTYSDPFLDTFSRPAVLSGQPYANHFGRSGIYGRFDQMIYRPDPESPRGLTLFGVAAGNLSGRVQEDAFFELGLLQLGTFAGRDLDTIGFVVNDQHFSNLFTNNIIAARTAVGASPNITHDEVMMELAYGLQITPAARLSPNLQCIINPDQSSVPFLAHRIPNAFVYGTKFTVDLTTLANYAAMR